ncbi:hypothetical protein ANN_20559 [Periplaneta americana]|uniref:Uncharacterized protein n=1 Tax=Periplaneta americana TaxID=6978 RepID=A0ABQ8SD52_PERAM|nr:hypothetical protein ANN_20559 [Periplaneta americana]
MRLKMEFNRKELMLHSHLLITKIKPYFYRVSKTYVYLICRLPYKIRHVGDMTLYYASIYYERITTDRISFEGATLDRVQASDLTPMQYSANGAMALKWLEISLQYVLCREDLRTTVVGIATTRLKLLHTSWDPVRTAKLSICLYWVEGKPRKKPQPGTCSDRESNPGHLVSRPDALTVTPQFQHHSFFTHSFRHSFISYSVHFTRSILLHIHIASIRSLHFVISSLTPKEIRSINVVVFPNPGAPFTGGTNEQNNDIIS